MRSPIPFLLTLLFCLLVLPGGAAAQPEVRNQELTVIDLDGGQSDNFGNAIAIEDEIMAIGASGHTAVYQGAVYLYRKRAGVWTFLTKVFAPTMADFEYFGWAIGLSGTTLAVGAVGDGLAVSGGGAVYIFERHEGGPDAWGLVATLTASDAGQDDRFGDAIDLVGSTLVVGAHQWDAPGLTNSGTAYVFERNLGGPGNWGEAAKLVPFDAGSYNFFGDSVSTTGNVVVGGAPWDSDGGQSSGSAYVFERNAGGPGAWGWVKKLTASDAQGDDRFGSAVAAQGNTIVVGAYYEDEVASEAGAAYVFQPGVSGWEEQVKLIAPDGVTNDRFGWAVAVDGEAVVVTAPSHAVWGVGTNGTTGMWTAAGSAYIFEPDLAAPSGWSESIRMLHAPLGTYEGLGNSIAAHNGRVLLGVGILPEGSIVELGAALLFKRADPILLPSLTGSSYAVLVLVMMALGITRLTLARRAASERR